MEGHEHKPFSFSRNLILKKKIEEELFV